MSTSEAIDELCRRVDSIELALGDTSDLQDGELCSKLIFVTQELRRLFREGHHYSEDLLELLKAYASHDHERSENYLERLYTVTSCHDRMNKSLRDLRMLETAYRNLFKFDHLIDNNQATVVKIQRLCDLPQLMNACNILLVNSLSLAERFMAWNVRSNEYFYHLNARLNKLEDDIDSQPAKSESQI